MNFYKHHLGDYAAATAHLSWDEDCAYRRLIDQYYKREVALPVEVREVCRLARATTPAQRKAVEVVLREFFTLRDDGWHQKRCDEEIGAATNQAETNRRIAAEREAKRRRTKHEPSDDPPHDPSTNRSPVSDGERKPSQTPDSISQTPDLKTQEREMVADPPSPPPFCEPDAPEEPEPPPGVTPTEAGLACRAIKAAGIADVNPGHPGLHRLLEGGVTAADLAATAAELVSRGKPKFQLLLATHEGRLRDAVAAGKVPERQAAPQVVDQAAETRQLLAEQAEHARQAVPPPEAVRERLAAARKAIAS